TVLRNSLAWSMPGTRMVWVYSARPVTFSRPSSLGTERPICEPILPTGGLRAVTISSVRSFRPAQQNRSNPVAARPRDEAVDAHIRLPHAPVRVAHVRQGARPALHDLIIVADEVLHQILDLAAQCVLVDRGDAAMVHDQPAVDHDAVDAAAGLGVD